MLFFCCETRVGVSAYLAAQEQLVYENVESSQILNIGQAVVTFDNIMINEEENSSRNTGSRRVQQGVASEEMIQGEQDQNIDETVDLDTEVEGANAGNWENEDQSELENNSDTGEESSDYLKGEEEVHSDESSSSSSVLKVKKRKRGDKTKLKRNLNKKLRMLGKDYLGFTGMGNILKQNQPRGKRKMGPRCESAGCKRSSLRKCSEIMDDEIKQLFEMFWSELSWDQRKIYVANNVIRMNPKRRYTSEPTSRRS